MSKKEFFLKFFKFVAVIVFLVMLFSIIAVNNAYKDRLEVIKGYKLEQKIAQLENANKNLKREIEELKSKLAEKENKKVEEANTIIDNTGADLKIPDQIEAKEVK